MYTMMTCSGCGVMYEELKAIADWMEFHPARSPICISCDPQAEKPALVRVTAKGKDYYCNIIAKELKRQ